MFVTFEGIDFSGKSTQIRLLVERLEAEGHHVLLVREPGGTIISEHIRDLLLDPAHGNMDEVTEFLLFSSSRSQLVREAILPALQSGTHVIADRFYDSSTAYQGYGRGLDIDTLQRVHQLAAHGLRPDLTFFIDIPVAVSFERRVQRDGSIDRMEGADRTFFDHVRLGYHAIAEQEAQRFVTLDGTQDIDALAAAIWRKVSDRLHHHPFQKP